MRRALLTLTLAGVGLLVVWARIGQPVTPPPIGPGVEPLCAETMQRNPPDFSWVAEGRAQKTGEHGIETVAFGALLAHRNQLIRVAGVLHAEAEWVGLYPSRATIDEEPSRTPWVALHSLWPSDPHWLMRGPSISDRCVVVEGTYADRRDGRLDVYSATIRDVLRLDVWSTPHRPLPTPPPPPSAPPPVERVPSTKRSGSALGSGHDS